MLKRETLEDVLRICLQWTSSAHLDVDDIYKAPIFDKTLTLVWSEYEQAGLKEFQGLLKRFEESTPGNSAALVITRPPEILNVLKIAAQPHDVYAVFDSHPREKHPDGAAFIFHTSLEETAHYLSELLQYDPRLLADSAMQWQAQLLANYCAHLFVVKTNLEDSSDLMEAVMDSSLEVLALKADLSELVRLHQSLLSDNNRLSEENMKLEEDVEVLRDAVHTLERSVDNASRIQASGPPDTTRPPLGWISSSSRSGPSTFNGLLQMQNQADTPPVPPPKLKPSSSSKGKLVMRSTDEVDDDDFVFATRIQLEWQEEDVNERDASAELAAQQQREYEEEDGLLREQLKTLQDSTPATFNCGICLEEETVFMVARIESCGHEFCRGCVKGYLQSKLGEHRFPILCPSCAAEKTIGEVGTVSSVLAQQIGLTEEEFAIFTELEMAAFSVLLHCRRCKEAVFVDKSEYDAQDIIACPLPGCNHAWCKNCSRSIEVGGPPHSCDGTSELNHLMDEHGWKYCPGCRTPIARIDGCNHMTCMAPGCNTHFCYSCGEIIVRSVLRQEIQRALSNHYTRCALIDDIPDVVRPRHR